MRQTATAEDEALVQRARQGDREAFATLVERHYPRIYRLAFRWLGHAQDAEDVAQEVCVKLARAIHAFRGECAFGSWVHGITLNTLRDRAGTRQGVELPLEDYHAETIAAPGPDPEQGLLGALIRRCIRLLPQALRMAVLLVHGEGLTHREAGVALACAEGTISWRLSEARKRLAHCLDQGGKSGGRS